MPVDRWHAEPVGSPTPAKSYARALTELSVDATTSTLSWSVTTTTSRKWCNAHVVRARLAPFDEPA